MRGHAGPRYVALGSSMAAGPGVTPRAPGSPLRAGRSAANYPHLVAEALDLQLEDVTFSGATTQHVLDLRQSGEPPQIEALTGAEELVTITIGGNDVGYVPGLMVATLPVLVRRLPVLRRAWSLVDPAAREAALTELPARMTTLARAVRARAPEARVVFVDYLTLLPPAGEPAWPLSVEQVELFRHVATVLEQVTASTAAAEGCELVSAAAASRAHHAWSHDPWTRGPGLLLPRQAMPYHPTHAGMRAVADLVVDRVRGDQASSAR